MLMWDLGVGINSFVYVPFSSPRSLTHCLFFIETRIGLFGNRRGALLPPRQPIDFFILPDQKLSTMDRPWLNYLDGGCSLCTDGQERNRRKFQQIERPAASLFTVILNECQQRILNTELSYKLITITFYGLWRIPWHNQFASSEFCDSVKFTITIGLTIVTIKFSLARARKVFHCQDHGYQMVDDKSVAEQIHEIINLEYALADAEIKLPEKFLVMSIVHKFSKSQENFGMTLKHQKGRLSMDDLMIAISIKEEHRN
ncbi:hypothetical protein Sango_2925200 [Sesamum angolense]|uniref:Uncharacterized protein n=1 Tax=Sesamum angolense TaxID=2727404 RepID=A0AAE1T4W6_9LAMI|nr:hypothetical protein Sango_2925200 [Sesamum angolense]